MGIRTKVPTVVFIAQAVIILLIAAATLVTADGQTALACLAGGFIAILATTVFGLRVFYGRPEWLPERFLQRFYRAELQKLALIAILIFAAIEWMGFSALPLVLSCAATLLANWFVLLTKI